MSLPELLKLLFTEKTVEASANVKSQLTGTLTEVRAPINIKEDSLCLSLNKNFSLVRGFFPNWDCSQIFSLFIYRKYHRRQLF